MKHLEERKRFINQNWMPALTKITQFSLKYRIITTIIHNVGKEFNKNNIEFGKNVCMKRPNSHNELCPKMHFLLSWK